jgi:hypothetical protein
MILLSSLLLLVAGATVVAFGVTAISIIKTVVGSFAVCWRPFSSLLMLSFLVLLAFPRSLSNLPLLVVLLLLAFLLFLAFLLLLASLPTLASVFFFFFFFFCRWLYILDFTMRRITTLSNYRTISIKW